MRGDGMIAYGATSTTLTFGRITVVSTADATTIVGDRVYFSWDSCNQPKDVIVLELDARSPKQLLAIARTREAIERFERRARQVPRVEQHRASALEASKPQLVSRERTCRRVCGQQNQYRVRVQ